MERFSVGKATNRTETREKQKAEPSCMHQHMHMLSLFTQLRRSSHSGLFPGSILQAQARPSHAGPAVKMMMLLLDAGWLHPWWLRALVACCSCCCRCRCCCPMASHGIAWHSMAWHSMAWHGTAWHASVGWDVHREKGPRFTGAQSRQRLLGTRSRSSPNSVRKRLTGCQCNLVARSRRERKASSVTRRPRTSPRSPSSLSLSLSPSLSLCSLSLLSLPSLARTKNTAQRVRAALAGDFHEGGTK